jgi:hypothetical protein
MQLLLVLPFLGRRGNKGDACELLPEMSAHIASFWDPLLLKHGPRLLDQVMSEALSVFTAEVPEYLEPTHEHDDAKHRMAADIKGSADSQLQHEAQQKQYNGRSSYNLLNGCSKPIRGGFRSRDERDWVRECGGWPSQKKGSGVF